MILGQVAKQPGEKFSLTADFVNVLGSGETISTAAVTAKNKATGVDSSATVLTGSATISTPKIIQTVIAGTAGDSHVVQFKATTSAGNIFEGEVERVVRES